MNKQKKGFIHIGFSSILMVFTSSWLIKGNKKKGKAQSRRYQRQSTRINCDFTRLVL